MISIKSDREIGLMREAGSLTAQVFEALNGKIVPGMTTKDIERIAEKVIREGGGIPASKGYGGFPGAICTSVNEVVVHGIPSERKVLKDGDIVSVDVVVQLNGYHGDACRTYPVGICKDEVLKLVERTEEAFENGVKLVKEGAYLGDIEAAIEETVKKYGYNVPREFTGHGIGSSMHEDPYIPNYGKKGSGPILKAGMTLAIEPMVMMGGNAIRVLKDNWTAVSRDGKPSSHYENTILVTKGGYEILTKC